jgi:hypothetical protein
MTWLAEFPLDDGGTVLIQVDNGSAGDPVTRGRVDRVVTHQVQQSFEQAIGRVRPAAQALIHQFRSLADAPEEVMVEFGVELSAEAGAFIAAASTSANFKVSLTWRRPSVSTGDVV